jgi:hypothetical protein
MCRITIFFKSSNAVGSDSDKNFLITTSFVSPDDISTGAISVMVEGHIIQVRYKTAIFFVVIMVSAVEEIDGANEQLVESAARTSCCIKKRS